MNNRKNFITTTSKETAGELKKCGFKLVQEGGGKWTFMNDAALKFDSKDNSKKVVYTDMLSI